MELVGAGIRSNERVPDAVSTTPTERTNQRPSGSGFTLIEILISLAVVGLTTLALGLVLRTTVMARTEIMNNNEARQKAAAALEMITQDLRGAGSGVDAGYTTPQLAIAYVDSVELMLCADFSGGSVSPIDTLAYDPGGSPTPYKLTGSYVPPIKYRTGAELVRWTLDLDNDGTIGAGDLNDANGVDSKRSPNPNDYTLVRQIYADSLSGVAGNNVGAVSRVAPILKPGGGVPPLFTVKLVNGTTWNWASGPVPAAQLKDIASVGVSVTASSSRPDSKGRYARVTLSTTSSLARVKH